MDDYSKYILENIENQKVSVRKLSELTGIPYMSLHSSLLNDARARPLRAGEYMKICKVMNLDPFMTQKNC